MKVNLQSTRLGMLVRKSVRGLLGVGAPASGEELPKAISDAIGLAKKGQNLTDDEVESLRRASRKVFRHALRGSDPKQVNALLTKFHDAGPRSAPTRAFSKTVPGRPQNGADGNRVNRWHLPPGDPQFATRRDGTLVEIRYILQALSMEGAPALGAGWAEAWAFLVPEQHQVAPGKFRDPIQGVAVALDDVLQNPRLVTSGHLKPLAEGGQHVPDNCSLMLQRSNVLQGSATLQELAEESGRVVAFQHLGWQKRLRINLVALARAVPVPSGAPGRI
jgi:hypothetical protein